MRACYSTFIRFYGIFLLFASFFNKKANEWVRGRKNWRKDLSEKVTDAGTYCWIHCASAGEFEQAIPLIRKIRDRKPDIRIAVSFFSPSGMEMYKNSKWADIFFYLPLDTASNAISLIELLKPQFAIFIRNEIWWNMLSTLNQKNIPTYLVNANLKQHRNAAYQYYLDKVYPLFTKIFDTKTVGNTKIERAIISNAEEKFSDAVIENFCRDSFCIALGSSWHTEEKFIAEFYKKNKLKYPNLKIIIAPHEFDDAKQAALEALFNCKIAKYSTVVSEYLSPQNPIPEILFLDKKGILKYVYRYVAIAVIGGGFGKGLHNISESTVYGTPAIFGPNYTDFEEVQEMIDLGVAFCVKNYAEFEKKILELSNRDVLNKIVNKKELSAYISKQQDVSEEIIYEILK